MKYALLFFLLFVILPVSHAQEQIPRFVRTVVYKAVQKDTTWTTGAVVERIRFVKFNKKGLKVIENYINPNGSVQTKTVYFYDDNNTLIEKADYLGIQNTWQIFAYTYDEKGRIIQITEKDLNRKDQYVTTVSYDSQDRIIQRIVENLHDNKSTTYDMVYAEDGGKSKVITTSTNAKQFINELQKSDTASLRSSSVVFATQYLKKPDKPKDALFENDENNNWIKKTEYKNGDPEVIVLRDIEYYGEKTDLDDLLLLGKVKSVEQISYVPIPTNSEVVYKGDIVGNYYTTHFNSEGKKTSREEYADAGKLIRKTEWEYDTDKRIIKEVHRASDNTLQSYEIWAYNRDDNVRTKIRHDAKDNIIRIGIYGYDLEYNCIREVWQNSDTSIYSDIRYVYNPYGQQIGVNPIEHVDGGENLYSVRRQWNFKGRLLEEQVTLLPGTGRNLFTYKYSTKGEVISGTERWNGQELVGYTYKFRYDDQGNWIIRIKYVNEVPVAYEERKYVYYK